MDTIMEAKDIVRVFRTGGEDFTALSHVDMEIPRQSLVILKGRSGSGKTTLLNILSTLDAPTSGDVFFEDIRYGDLSVEQLEKLRRENIGFVFQSVALIPIMNAYENVDFSLRLAGVPEEERDARIREVLALVGMDERMMHMPGQMSGGEQQRIAIARAIAPKPKVIFADEPTGALDTATGLRVMDLFSSLIEKEGITIVMTTHDPNLMDMGDMLYEMEDGELTHVRK